MLDLYTIRKKLHQIPEIGFQEFKTQALLRSVLSRYACFQIHTFDFTGILVEYSHGKGGYKLFRADMDALPIAEQTGSSFSSIHSGFMHACGHDIHMTILLGLIDSVATRKLEQNILFLFQPAEEGLGGAKRIIDTNILEQFSIKACYALHVSGKFPIGTVSTRKGVFFASTQEVNVRISGHSSHVAFPEDGKDALWATELFLQLIRTLVLQTNKTGKQVLCYFGKVVAGDVRNAIVAKSYLEGTMRAFDPNQFAWLQISIEKIAQEVEEKTNTTISIEYKNFYQSVHNNPDLVDQFRMICQQKKIKYVESSPVLTGEDFGFFSQLYPSLLFWLGVADNHLLDDLHSPRFLPNSDAIPIGVQIFQSILDYS